MTPTTAPPIVKRATRAQLTPPGTYGPAPHDVLARTDITPAAKLIYFALLDHLGRVGTLVYPGEVRLARMTGLSISSVRRGIRQLEKAQLIATHPHPGRTPAHSFTPPAQGQVETNPGQIDRTPGQIDRRTNIPKQQQPALRSQPLITTGRDTVDVALDWEEALGLDKTPRTEAKDAGDFQALVSVAEALAAGRLGRIDAATANLSTLAHQVGHRDPGARSPLGMFLAEVGRMRIRACRSCNHLETRVGSST